MRSRRQKHGNLGTHPAAPAAPSVSCCLETEERSSLFSSLSFLLACKPAIFILICCKEKLCPALQVNGAAEVRVQQKAPQPPCSDCGKCSLLETCTQTQGVVGEREGERGVCDGEVINKDAEKRIERIPPAHVCLFLSGTHKEHNTSTPSQAARSL